MLSMWPDSTRCTTRSWKGWESPWVEVVECALQWSNTIRYEWYEHIWTIGTLKLRRHDSPQESLQNQPRSLIRGMLCLPYVPLCVNSRPFSWVIPQSFARSLWRQGAWAECHEFGFAQTGLPKSPKTSQVPLSEFQFPILYLPPRLLSFWSMLGFETGCIRVMLEIPATYVYIYTVNHGNDI